MYFRYYCMLSSMNGHKGFTRTLTHKQIIDVIWAVLEVVLIYVSNYFFQIETYNLVNMLRWTQLYCSLLDWPILIHFNNQQEDAAMENNMKMEVAGKLKKHFNSVQKQSNTSPGVSVLVVSTHTHIWETVCPSKLQLLSSVNMLRLKKQPMSSSRSLMISTWITHNSKA